MEEARIIVVDANVSLTPYLNVAAQSAAFEVNLDRMGFEVREEVPGLKIGFLEAAARPAAK